MNTAELFGAEHRQAEQERHTMHAHELRDIEEQFIVDVCTLVADNEHVYDDAATEFCYERGYIRFTIGQQIEALRAEHTGDFRFRSADEFVDFFESPENPFMCGLNPNRHESDKHLIQSAGRVINLSLAKPNVIHDRWQQQKNANAENAILADDQARDAS